MLVTVVKEYTQLVFDGWLFVFLNYFHVILDFLQFLFIQEIQAKRKQETEKALSKRIRPTFSFTGMARSWYYWFYQQ